MLLGNRYQLGERLGRGGAGEVWRADDLVLERSVAVKLLRSDRADETAIERFRREALAAGRLNHPNVVAVYDFGTHADSLYLVMELVDGTTLTEELALRGKFSPELAVDVVAQTGAGLAAAHQRGLVHRDIKPGNLLVTADGTVKIADFGIARFTSDTTDHLTSTGQIVGTTYYLAPERATGSLAGPESDVYSLGCVLYQLVTGHPPFDADTPAGVLYQHVDTPPVSPAEVRPELAGPFEDQLLQMLAKDPADRPTAQEIADWSTGPIPVLSRAPTPTRSNARRPAASNGLHISWTRAAIGLVAASTLSAALVIGVTRAVSPPQTPPANGSTVGSNPPPYDPWRPGPPPPPPPCPPYPTPTGG